MLCAEDAPTNALEGASADDQGTMQSMRVIYEQLANCFSSEQADEIAINFCFVQTKSMPLPRLVHTLCSNVFTYNLMTELLCTISIRL